MRKQSCPIATDTFHGGNNTSVCVGDMEEENIHFLGLQDQCQGERTYFLGLEEQCRLSGGGNLLARLQSAGLQEIFKWSETPRSHVVTDNQAQAP